MSGLELPRLALDTVCCPRCHQRTGYRHDGLTAEHWLPNDGGLCPAVFPPYVRAHRGPA